MNKKRTVLKEALAAQNLRDRFWLGDESPWLIIGSQGPRSVPPDSLLSFQFQLTSFSQFRSPCGPNLCWLFALYIPSLILPRCLNFNRLVELSGEVVHGSSIPMRLFIVMQSCDEILVVRNGWIALVRIISF